MCVGWKVESKKCGVYSVKCKSGECKVLSVEWKVECVKCGVYSGDCGVESVKCGV